MSVKVSFTNREIVIINGDLNLEVTLPAKDFDEFMRVVEKTDRKPAVRMFIKTEPGGMWGEESQIVLNTWNIDFVKQSKN